MDKWEYQNKPCYLENRGVRELCKRRTACTCVFTRYLQINIVYHIMFNKFPIFCFHNYFNLVVWFIDSKDNLIKKYLLLSLFCQKNLIGSGQNFVLRNCKIIRWAAQSGPPRLARLPRPGPCLEFGFHYKKQPVKKNRGRI